MSSYHEEKYKEKQDRLNKDLEDAKNAEERQLILMKYGEENIKQIKLLLERNEQRKREMNDFFDTMTFMRDHMTCLKDKDLEDVKSAEEKQTILMKCEEENIQKIKLLQEQNEQLKREMRDVYNTMNSVGDHMTCWEEDEDYEED